jgi:hypothetical protein
MSAEGLHPADERHEQRDVHRRALAIFAICFIAFLVLSVAVLWLTFGQREGGFAAAQPRTQLPANGELGQRQQLARYLAAQQAFLGKLAWTDASHQVAKLPIDDAMRLLAAKGAARPRPPEARP